MNATSVQPAPTSTSPRTAAWLAAKAKAETAQPEIIAITGDQYLTLGAHGDYTQTRDGLSFRCDCPAGAHGIPCYHVAAVALLPHEVYRRALLRSVLHEARHLTTAPACPGYLRAHPATAERIAGYWCERCEADCR